MSRPSWIRQAGLAIALVALVTSGCANIPEQSSPQALRNSAVESPGVVTPPDPKANPYDLVRGFIGKAGNPEAAKTYLTEQARQRWPVDSTPTIIEETFGTAPAPLQERRGLGDEQGNQVIVVLSVANIGRLGADRAFVPAAAGKKDEYRVLVRREDNGPWRIDNPPDPVLITSPDFNNVYQRVNLYFFDPDLQVTVPDRRYVVNQPAGGAPAQVIQLLLLGPSDVLDGAVKTLLNNDTTTLTNVVPDADGALVVNLTKLGDKPVDDKQKIAAQIVLSLQGVTNARIRLMVDGRPLIAGHVDWRPSDVLSYDAPTKPNADLPGLFVADRRVRSLRDGGTIPGPAGTGEYQVRSAAQSIDGKSLAVVVQATPTGVRLRVGGIDSVLLSEVDLNATTLTRPTWRLPTTADAASNEVWTVQNGTDVVRVLRTGDGIWDSSPVNASELTQFGPISDLRLSRDGVRVAAVVKGRVVVASVVRTEDSVTVRFARELQGKLVANVVGVDWLNQDTLVAAIRDSSVPVISTSSDGFAVALYSSANLLNAPVTAITAAPERDVVVTDNRGMWTASEIGEVWQLQSPHQVPGAWPFYPG